MKKMRRMIPALCMLLVSAIMLTTASYAWFTMSEQVTTTGMQVQAKATGSLVISSSALKYNVTDTEVDFSEDAIKQLAPIHLNVTKDDNGKITNFVAWETPEEDAVIHKELGTLTYGSFVTAPENVAKASYFDKVVYIGTTGDTPITEAITVDLRAIASAAGEATQAYSVAVYAAGVVGTETLMETVAYNEVPVAVVHVDTAEARNEATFTLPEDMYIPSIVGVGAQSEETTGLKVVLRVFVDGDLDKVGATKPVWDGTYTYKSESGAYVASKTYFTPAGYVALTVDELKTAVGGVVPTNGWFVADESAESGYVAATAGEEIEWNDDGTATTTYYVEAYAPADLNNLLDKTTDEETGAITATLPNGWFTRTEDKVDAPFNFVNSDDIPSSGSTLAINFKMSEEKQ